MRANSFTIILVLALLALGAGGYWVYQHVERYEEPAAARYSRKALRDPFLAADYLLRELGTVPMRDPLLKQLDKLPPQGSVILTTPSNLITEKQAKALTRWLRKGGHLIAIAGSDSDVHADPLLGPYGIRRDFKFVFGNDTDDDSKKSEKLSDQLREINRQIQSGKKIEDIAEDERADVTSVLLEDNGAPLSIAFDRNHSLKHAAFGNCGCDEKSAKPFYWADQHGRVHFAQFDVGDGLLTVVSDLDFLTSSQIGKHDHALALQQFTDTKHGVSLIADVDMPPLTQLLWQWARELIVAIAVLIAAWVWAHARRFGPVRDPQSQIRRSLAEHIRASATWLWRHHHADALLDAARRQVLQRARQRFADFDTQEKPQQLELLGAYSALDRNALQLALFDAAPRDAQAFSDAVATLQTLQLQLTKPQ